MMRISKYLLQLDRKIGIVAISTGLTRVACVGYNPANMSIQTIEDPAAQFHHAILSNGLTVLAEILPGAITTAVGLFVRTGSRDETPRESGISHFLEHMVFKGSSRRTAWDVNRELDELGGQGNAYTGEEETAYHTTVLPRYQNRAVDLLCDFLRPALREVDVESERLVILEEIAKYQDQPPFGAAERLSELYFRNHPLAGRILGTVDSVQAITADDIRKYLDRRYCPSNCVFVAAGAVDFQSLLETLESQTLGLSGGELTSRSPPNPSQDIVCDRIMVPDAAGAYVLRCGPAPTASDLRRYAMRITASILGDEGGSRFFWDLIDSGRAETAVAWVQEYGDCGLFSTFLSCDPDEVDDCLAMMDQAAERLIMSLTCDELKQAISRATASTILSSERPSNRMFAVGESWMSLGRYETLDEVLAGYRGVTVKEVGNVIEQFGLRSTAEVRVVPR